MVFAHDTEVSLQAAAVLANSGLEPDTLDTLEDLDAFYAEFEYTGRRDRDDAEVLANSMLADARALPQLVRHDHWDWHLHAVDPDAPLATRIAVETAMAMVDVIRSDELTRLGICADDTCRGIVLDLSRNRSRRFCSTACGNRNAVAAYRARQASS